MTDDPRLGQETIHPANHQMNCPVHLASNSAAIRQYLNGLEKAGVETLSPKWSGFFHQLMRLDQAQDRPVDSPQPTMAAEGKPTFQTSAPKKSTSTGPNQGSRHPVRRLHDPDSSAVVQPPYAGKGSAESQSSAGLPTGTPIEVSQPGLDSQRVGAAELRPDLRPYPNSLDVQFRIDRLQQLQQQVTQCQRCAQLASCRSKTVFGEGIPSPRLVFLGEAPGADEDRQGQPFVGAAGQLLDKIMAACRFQRSDVYILNTIKCRPPNNRNPLPEELANCWTTFTEQQLEILQPEFICCLGAVASRQLLKTTQPLGQLRKKFHAYRESKVMVTYHPAYLLRTESAKKYVWEDMQMLMKEMGFDLKN